MYLRMEESSLETVFEFTEAQLPDGGGFHKNISRGLVFNTNSVFR